LLHYLTGAPMGSFRHRRWHAGPDAFIRAAEDAARRNNVSIRTDAEVAQITVRDDAVTGVVLSNGEEIPATCVLSTVDPARTLMRMIDPVWLDPEFLHAVRNIKFRGCTSYVLYALDPLPELPNLAAENWRSAISLTSSMTQLERAADRAKYGEVPEMPHIELSVPTERWPERSFAPKGRHVMVARVQYTPHQLRNAEWAAAKSEALGDQVTSAIDLAVPCLSSRILHRVVLTPRDVEERFGLTEGAHTHGELMLDQVLFMRPVPGHDRYAMPIDGLYLGGAGTHPGPGIIGGAGWLAAQRVLTDRGR
ncbi:MAG: phytoene desaturase family protein, partial [Longimicrobiales bacterium]